MNVSRSRTVSLADPVNPFSLITQTDTETMNGRKYSYSFTAATRTYVDTTPGGRTTTTLLDSLERVSSLQPTGLALTTFSYDSRGRLASILEGTRNTSFAYDGNGNLASVTDPLNLTRSYTYDTDGRVLTTTLEDGRVITFAPRPILGCQYVLIAEDVFVEVFIAELPPRVVLPTQLNKLRHLLVDTLQFRPRRGKQLSPVRTRTKRD